MDIVIVAAAAFGLTWVAGLLLQNTPLMGQEWQLIAAFGLTLFAVIFLYGGAAGTIGTIGENLTRMRVVTIDDGKDAGFRAGGLRAVGWFLYVIFTVMLSDTGATESRFVAVRSNTGFFRGERSAPGA